MELDELKQSWNALGNSLPQHPLMDEKKIAELLERYRKRTGKSLRSLVGFQRFSLVVGGLAMLACIVIGCVISTQIEEKSLQSKAYALLLFFAATMVTATWWDYKTYRWTRAIAVDEMPVAEVNRRMIIFRHWMRYEVWAICFWAILFDLLYCWAIEAFQYGIWACVGIIGFLISFEAIVIILFYYAVIYRHLNNIKRNIEELDDVCTE